MQIYWSHAQVTNSLHEKVVLNRKYVVITQQEVINMQQEVINIQWHSNRKWLVCNDTQQEVICMQGH
jgi:hypothetical protein